MIRSPSLSRRLALRTPANMTWREEGDSRRVDLLEDRTTHGGSRLCCKHEDACMQNACMRPIELRHKQKRTYVQNFHTTYALVVSISHLHDFVSIEGLAAPLLQSCSRHWPAGRCSSQQCNAAPRSSVFSPAPTPPRRSGKQSMVLRWSSPGTR